MIYLFDSKKKLTNIIPKQDILSHTQTSKLNSTITAAFSAVYKAEIEAAHYFGAKDVDDDSIFWMYKITSTRKQDGTVEVSGIYLLFDDLQAGVIRDIRPQNRSAAYALGQILDGTGWQVGLDQTTGTASGSFYYVPKTAAFWDFLSIWQVEYKPRMTYLNGEITGKYIDIYDRVSGDFGKWYEYGDKLLTVVGEQASESIYTALIGRGKGEQTEGGGFGRKLSFADVYWSTAEGDPVDKPLGQDYVALPSAVDIYGFRENIAEFAEVEDPEVLLQLTYEQLLNTCRPKVQFSATALETGLAEVGETVAIIRSDLGIRYKTRIFEVLRDFLDKSIKTFQLGDKVATSQAERAISVQKTIKAKETEYLSLYEQNRLAIVDSYYNGDAYEYRLKVGNPYGLPAGTYSFDRPIDQDPTEVIYIGAGKYLIANSKNPDGSWNWRTFADGSGLGAGVVGADQIIAGTITADHIKAGSLTVSDIYVGGNPLDGYLEAQEETLLATVKSTDVEYYLSTSISTPTGGSWQTTAPQWTQGKYMWSRTKVTYTDNRVAYTPSATGTCIAGAKGTDGEQGKDAVSVVIVSTNGDAFKNGIIQTVLRAVVYEGTSDVTDSIDANRFRWSRISDDPTGDTAWNNRYFSGTKNVPITTDDVNKRATFTCEILA